MHEDQFGDRFGLSDGEYAPDPERDTQLIVEGFLHRIAAVVRARGLSGALIGQIKRLMRDLEAANAHRVVDEPARYNLRMTVLVLAGYRVLHPVLSQEEAMSVVQAAFVEPLGADMLEGTRAMLDATEDPYAAMVALSKSRETYAFGDGFSFEHPADDDRSYFADVHRCFYHDVLVAESAAELTPVMCAFDGNWIAAIDPERHGFTFDRATTIGLGGSHCPFHFRRSAAGHKEIEGRD